MNLNFKTHFPWPGPDGQPEPTHFQQQIRNAFAPEHTSKPRPGEVLGKKLHSIRRINGAKPRFREGMKLTMSTGSRFKPERFMTTECTGVQWLQMSVETNGPRLDLRVHLIFPGYLPWLFQGERLERLAHNDGLSVEQFVRWFTLDVLTHGPGRFEVVHWTDERY